MKEEKKEKKVMKKIFETKTLKTKMLIKKTTLN